MTTYSMQQIANITGISAHTLRIWERRYDFLNPQRTDTNIRYYTDEELKKLLNIGILVRSGVKVSQVDKLNETEINAKVATLLEEPSTAFQNEVDSLIMSTLELNEREFDKVFQRLVIHKGLLTAVVEVIYPFLQQLGILWGTSKLIPAQEHFISNLIRQKIIAAIDLIPTPSADSPGAVLFLLDGETHELGLLLAAYIAKKQGYRLFYLGQNVPLENVEKILEIGSASLMITLFIMPRPKAIQQYIKSLTADASKTLIVSGNIENKDEFKELRNFHILHSPTQLVDLLSELN